MQEDSEVKEQVLIVEYPMVIYTTIARNFCARPQFLWKFKNTKSVQAAGFRFAELNKTLYDRIHLQYIYIYIL